jgi:hypothetical protein
MEYSTYMGKEYNYKAYETYNSAAYFRAHMFRVLHIVSGSLQGTSIHDVHVFVVTFHAKNLPSN